MRFLAATVFAACLLAAVAGAATAGAGKLTPAESKWFAPLATDYGKFALALSLVQSEELAKNALVTGSTTNHTLVETLSIFTSCKSWIKAAGKAPTARLAPFLTSMQASCGHLYTGSLAIAKAIGALREAEGQKAATLLKQGTTELKKGSTLLAQAERQAVAISGSSSLKR
ncbi:MAG TPA: hypothetical protein VG265_06295 [Gaiellaceae bacterium]|nr:hypothetical protein [Gaiellaceae bacterium]